MSLCLRFIDCVLAVSSSALWVDAWTASSGLTVGVHVLTQLRLGLPVGPVAGFVGQSGRHGGGRDDGLEGSLPLLHVELRVEDDDVDFGHVEHPQSDGGAQVHRDGQRGGLDVELQGDEEEQSVQHIVGLKQRLDSETLTEKKSQGFTEETQQKQSDVYELVIMWRCSEPRSTLTT